MSQPAQMPELGICRYARICHARSVTASGLSEWKRSGHRKHTRRAPRNALPSTAGGQNTHAWASLTEADAGEPSIFARSRLDPHRIVAHATLHDHLPSQAVCGGEVHRNDDQIHVKLLVPGGPSPIISGSGVQDWYVSVAVGETNVESGGLPVRRRLVILGAARVQNVMAGAVSQRFNRPKPVDRARPLPVRTPAGLRVFNPACCN